MHESEQHHRRENELVHRASTSAARASARAVGSMPSPRSRSSESRARVHPAQRRERAATQRHGSPSRVRERHGVEQEPERHASHVRRLVRGIADRVDDLDRWHSGIHDRERSPVVDAIAVDGDPLLGCRCTRPGPRPGQPQLLGARQQHADRRSPAPMSAPPPAPRPHRTRCPAHRSNRFQPRWPSPVQRPRWQGQRQPTTAYAATRRRVSAARAASATATAVASTTTPTTRSSDGIGCDLLSRCATSQTRGAGPPRVATRLTAEARRHGIVSTPSPSMRHDHRPSIARPLPKTRATRRDGRAGGAEP